MGPIELYPERCTVLPVARAAACQCAPRTMSLADATESIDTHSGAAFSCDAWEESQSDESSQEVSTVISGLNY